MNDVQYIYNIILTTLHCFAIKPSTASFANSKFSNSHCLICSACWRRSSSKASRSFAAEFVELKLYPHPKPAPFIRWVMGITWKNKKHPKGAWIYLKHAKSKLLKNFQHVSFPQVYFLVRCMVWYFSCSCPTRKEPSKTPRMYLVNHLHPPPHLPNKNTLTYSNFHGWFKMLINPSTFFQPFSTLFPFGWYFSFCPLHPEN